jgi:hypothetical protein
MSLESAWLQFAGARGFWEMEDCVNAVFIQDSKEPLTIAFVELADRDVGQ